MEFSSETRAKLDKLRKGREHLLLSVGTLRDGKIEAVHYDEAGNAGADKRLYPAGSICKVFTASALAKHIAAGEAALDDSLSKFIPDLPEGYYPTLRRLLTHHSGYGGAPFSALQTISMLAGMNKPDGILHLNPFRGYPDEKALLDTLKAKRLQDKDYKFSYSNFGFGVLGCILGRLEGTDYFGAMERYFAELGLSDTSLDNISMTGYDKKGNPCQPWQWERGDVIAPAGALVSSVEDLLAFAEKNLDGSLPYLSMCHERRADGEKGFDMGLAWRLKKDSAVSYHVGSAGAFSCILALDRENHTACAIGMNYALVDGIEDAAFAILNDLK